MQQPAETLKNNTNLFDISNEEGLYINLSNGKITVKDLVNKLEPKAIIEDEIVINNIIVPIALTSGFNDVRIMPNTNVGKVLPAPIVKKVIIKSSTDRATASKEAPITTGCIIGIVIVKNAFKGEAPRSLALSITL